MSEHLHETLGARFSGTLDESGTVTRFRGIPYGQLEARWTLAEIIESYPPDFDATRFGPKCPQIEEPNNTLDFGPVLTFPETGSDEFKCLSLNVTRPTRLEGLLPVFVFIHGGAFAFGAGSDPMWETTPLVRQSILAGLPIVAVTINYRLGPLGFLSPPNDGAGESSLFGNYGLHDQRLALTWVHRHIRGFGGDPDRITIAGESAGGCSVHAQIGLQEKLEEPLFQRGIIQSGTLAVMGFIGPNEMRRRWDQIASEAGLGAAGDVELLRTLPAEELLALPSLKVAAFPLLLDDYFISAPCFGPQGNFLPHIPRLQAIMHGDVRNEGNFFRQDAHEPGALEAFFRASWEQLGPERTAQLASLYQLEPDMKLEDYGRLLYRFPEDARFFLPSTELAMVWPHAAVFHLAATSPLSSSIYPEDSYHLIDMLYLFSNFDDHLRAEGLELDLDLCTSMQLAWLRFVHGTEPWQGAFEGIACTFDRDGIFYGPLIGARGWEVARTTRIEALRTLGTQDLIQLATTLYP